jgi:hypothetical protein
MQNQANRPNSTKISHQNKTPVEILDDYCRRVIAIGNYLDSQEIMHELVSILPKIKFLPLFHQIQSLNRFIDTSIEAYWHSNSIRIFLELEEFILRLYNKWSRSNHRTFEEIGVGSLGRHPKIVKYFEFFQNPFRKDLLPKISMESLIRFTTIYIDRSGGRGGGNNLEFNENTQENFQKFLFEKCRVEYGGDKYHLGISVDLKELFHKILATKWIETQEIRRVRESIAGQMRQKLLASYDEILVRNKNEAIIEQSKNKNKKGNSPFSHLLPLLQPHGINPATILTQLKTVFSPMLVINSNFKDIIEHLFTTIPLREIESSHQLFSFFTAPTLKSLRLPTNQPKSKKKAKKATATAPVTELSVNSTPQVQVLKKDFHIFQSSLAILTLFLWKSEKEVLASPVSETHIPTEIKATVSHVDITNGSQKPHKELFDVDDDDDEDYEDEGHGLSKGSLPHSVDPAPAMSRALDSTAVPPVRGPTSLMSPSSSLLRKYFDEKMSSDTPRYALTLLEKRLTQLMNELLVIDQETTASVRYDIPGLIAQIHASEEKVGPDLRLSVEDYVAAITASVLLFRLTTRQEQPGDEVDVNEIIYLHLKQSIPNADATASASIEVQLSGPENASGEGKTAEEPLLTVLERIFLQSFDSLEKTVTFELNLLSFELLNQGTFVTYLQKYFLTHPPSLSLIRHHLSPSIVSYLDNFSNHNNHLIHDCDQESSNQVFGIDNSQFVDVLMSALNEILSSISSDSHQDNLLDLLCQMESIICISFGVHEFSEISKISLWRLIQNLIISARTESCSVEMINALEIWQEFVTRLTNECSGDHGGDSDEIIFTETMPVSEKLLRHSACVFYKEHLSSSSSNLSLFDVETGIMSHLIDHYDTPRSMARSIAQDISQDSASLQPIPSNIHLDNVLFQPFPSPRCSATDFSAIDQSNIFEEALALISTTPMGLSCHDFCQWSSTYAPYLTSDTSTPQNHRVSVIDFILDNHDRLLALSSAVIYVPIKNDAYPVSNQLPTVDLLLNNISRDEWHKISAYLLAALTGVTSLIELTATVKSLLLVLYETLGWSSLVRFVTSTAFLLPEEHQLQCRGLELLFNCIAHCCDVDLSSVQTNLMESLLTQTDQLAGAKKLLGIALTNRSSSRATLWEPLCSYRSVIFAKGQTLGTNNNLTPEQMTVEARTQGEENRREANEYANTSTLSQSSPSAQVATRTMYPSPASESQTAYEVIQNLLVEDFGYSDDGHRPAADSPVTTKLKNALEHLSTSLYGSDVHFVMELVQNADDNTYEIGTKPTLKFQLYPHSVVVFNNEKGFLRENIIAICGVGGSTKKGLTGYIGQKGIG